jgi:NAD(P)-dependent dehydrogenase (short-subunit alcohol dehydrogenase family)
MSTAHPVAVVTGASGGIGRAIAVAIAATGAPVALCGRNATGGAETVSLIESAGGAAEFSIVDVTDYGQVASWIGRVTERHGNPGWLVNNAGMNGRSARLEETDVQEFEQVVATNLLGSFYTIRECLPGMRARGRGAIVNVGSTATLQGYATLSAYTASKHAVLGLTRSVALENADIPIRCNCICPGPVDTPLMRSIEELINPDDPAAAREMFQGTTAFKRYGQPEEVAELVLFLLEDRSSYITGTAISVDGGVMTGVG